jgi:hypothetical protein
MVAINSLSSLRAFFLPVLLGYDSLMKSKSTSSEKRLISPKTLDRDVPPLKTKVSLNFEFWSALRIYVTQ